MNSDDRRVMRFTASTPSTNSVAYGADCNLAMMELYACLSLLTCDEVVVGACADEVTAVDMAC